MGVLSQDNHVEVRHEVGDADPPAGARQARRVPGDRAYATPRNLAGSRARGTALAGPHRQPPRQRTRTPAPDRGKLSGVVWTFPTFQALLREDRRALPSLARSGRRAHLRTQAPVVQM